MRFRRLKKTALLVGCVVPGVGLLCGDELVKAKYHQRRPAPYLVPAMYLSLHTEAPERGVNIHEVSGASYSRVSLYNGETASLSWGSFTFDSLGTVRDENAMSPDAGTGMLIEELLDESTLEWLKRREGR